jgi:hypothetical protein
LVPESLGSKMTLYPGAVCTKCNKDLGASVDNKVFNEALMAMGQVTSGSKGKSGPRTSINVGKGTVSKTSKGVAVRGTVSGKPNEYLISRFLAKIAVNVLTHIYGSVSTRISHPDFIRFVKMPTNRKEVWPYAAIYTPLKPIVQVGVASKNSLIASPNPTEFNIVNMICASGVFAIPLFRDSDRAMNEARNFVKDCIESQKRNGVKFGMIAEYYAINKLGK